MTIFAKIIARELPADIVFENSHVIGFKDIHPVAPHHILIVTKKEIPDLQSMKSEDLFLMEEIVKAAQTIAKELNLEEGYRLVTNNGPIAGQQVSHLHFHLISGKKLNGMCG